jgi:hypothetical protein
MDATIQAERLVAAWAAPLADVKAALSEMLN